MTVGLSTTAIFGDLSGYFFGIFRDKASSITWRYATPCRLITDCKMNDLERLFDVKIRFWPALLESERLNVRNSTTYPILRCSVHCTISKLARLGRHAQLTRCFSAVAELLVLISEC